MKIESSTISMASSRSYMNSMQAKTTSIKTTAKEAEDIELSEEESKSLSTQLEDAKKAIEEQNKKRMQELLSKRNQNSKKVEGNKYEGKSKKELELEILKIMLKSFRDRKGIKSSLKDIENEVTKDNQIGFLTDKDGIAMSGSVGVWTRTTVSSAFYEETENTAFNANGVVKTADGREINFGISVEMSRSFSAKYESIVKENYICTDPLVINLKSNVASVSDQKFLFDLNSDGKKESISFAGEGSGFLALDKNKDGKINDGNELFGTKSGDGFKDLAAYDKDDNGWIDENDDVFKDLLIWSKDENGKNHLVNLKEAGVGAIYLGKASSQFSLNDAETNNTNAVIRSTGIYLKEDGGTGTIQHVDLAV